MLPHERQQGPAWHPQYRRRLQGVGVGRVGAAVEGGHVGEAIAPVEEPQHLLAAVARELEDARRTAADDVQGSRTGLLPLVEDARAGQVAVHVDGPAQLVE